MSLIIVSVTDPASKVMKFHFLWILTHEKSWHKRKLLENLCIYIRLFLRMKLSGYTALYRKWHQQLTRSQVFMYLKYLCIYQCLVQVKRVSFNQASRMCCNVAACNCKHPTESSLYRSSFQSDDVYRCLATQTSCFPTWQGQESVCQTKERFIHSIVYTDCRIIRLSLFLLYTEMICFEDTPPPPPPKQRFWILI